VYSWQVRGYDWEQRCVGSADSESPLASPGDKSPSQPKVRSSGTGEHPRVLDHRRFFNLSSDLLVVAGYDGRFRHVNPAWEPTLGWTEEELTAVPYLEFVHPEDRAGTAVETGRLVKGLRVFHFENRYRCRDGSYRWLQWTSTPEPEQQLVYGAARDITELKNAQRSSDRLAAIVSSSADAIIGKTIDGIITDWNPAAERIYGYTAHEIVGKSLDILCPPERLAELRTFQRRAASGERVEGVETVRIRRDGRRIDVSLTFSPIVDDRGVVRGIAVIARDITARNLADAEIRRAWESADRANRAKSDFLSRISHELRTPLNAVLGFGQLLEMDPLTAPQQDCVAQILKGGRHLLDLINEVLDIARIETGRLRLSIESVRLFDVIAETASLTEPLARQRGIALLPTESPGIGGGELAVSADLQRLKQVMLNLLSNAIKYNRPGGTVRVMCAAEPEFVRVGVRDTGPGIEPDLQSRLFTPFDRLGIEHTGVEGTGLGLALCKNLLELMDGRIWVESAPGMGSTFWFELPRSFAEAEEVPVSSGSYAIVSNPDAPSQTVLYVEVNLSNLRLVERLLAPRSDIRLVSAMQGRLGLELARQHRPSLILLDLHLPDIGGEEVFAELREDPNLAKVPVVIVSADATHRQVERLLATGAAAYLTKPLDVKLFLRTLEKALDKPRTV